MKKGCAISILVLLLVTALGLALAWPHLRPHIVGAAASALLHPFRRPLELPMPEGAREHTVISRDGLKLIGWFFPCEGERRGTVVYLHGVADNRRGVTGLARRFVPMGFDVVGMDSRAQGESAGEICSYGVFEKDDVRALIDTLSPGPVFLFGASLGAAIALQTAAVDPRVTGVVAIEPFSELRKVAEERAPTFFSREMIEDAFALAAEKGAYHADESSPLAAASKVRAAVLLIHGDADTDTSPEHSKRIHNALSGPRKLILVPGATHNRSVTPEVWNEIETWLLMQ